MFNKILLPLDGSELSEQALNMAVKIAEKADAQLTLLHVYALMHVAVPEMGDLAVAWPEQTAARSKRFFQDYLNELGEKALKSDVETKTVVLEGDAAAGILEYAEQEGFDLIVMSTHGYTGLTRWVLGSVTERVLRHAPCPVFAVRGKADIDNILVTLDGSELAENALAPAITVANMLDAKITLLSIRHPGIRTSAQDIVDLNSVEPGLGEIVLYSDEHAEEQYLEQVIYKHRKGADVEIVGQVRYGLAANEILDCVEDESIDLVVMCSHGRTGLQRWRYGSVTEKVLRHIEKSMLVVRAPKK